jgi:mono/diheme cytochrome c family protein
MAPMGASLSDADLAAVLTYIRGSWGNKSGAVSVDEMKAARAAISGHAPSAADLAKMTPVERGHVVFEKYGCFQCHGQDAKGGVANPNAKTAEQVPSLIYVADGYTKDELKSFIMRGERTIPVLHPDKPPPPHFMPSWGNVISTNELNNLADYLFSLKPTGDKLDF